VDDEAHHRRTLLQLNRHEKRHELARRPGKVVVVASALALVLLVLRRGVRRSGTLQQVLFPYAVAI
jgi:hypothetical protein